jgi:hypothetical protein
MWAIFHHPYRHLLEHCLKVGSCMLSHSPCPWTCRLTSSSTNYYTSHIHIKILSIQTTQKWYTDTEVCLFVHVLLHNLCSCNMLTLENLVSMVTQNCIISGLSLYCYTIYLQIYSETSIHVFVGGLKKKQWIRENNRCRSHSWNRIRSGTIEIDPGTKDRGFSV